MLNYLNTFKNNVVGLKLLNFTQSNIGFDFTTNFNNLFTKMVHNLLCPKTKGYGTVKKFVH